MQKEHAAQLNALQSELRETQKAFGDQLVKAHEQKINLINQHSVELRQADARTDAVREEMQEVQAAFTDYMARKQNELMERTTSLQKDVDSARSEAEAKQGELDQIQEAFNEHTQQTDDLIERKVTDARKARRAFCHGSQGKMPEARPLRRSWRRRRVSNVEALINQRHGCVASMACSTHHPDAIDAQRIDGSHLRRPAAPVGSGRRRRDERQKRGGRSQG